MDIRIIAAGTTYYIVGRGVTWTTGSGTPWTSSATTPFGLAMNDTSGERLAFRPAPAARPLGVGINVPTLIPLSADYEPVVEVAIPIDIRASSKEYAIDAKQALMRALDGWATGLPAQLYYLPNGVTAALYYEILGARWDDLPISWNEEIARPALRTVLTLTIRPHGSLDGGASSGDLLLNAVTFTNVATGNTSGLGSTGTGDLANEGQPMNVAFTPSATNARWYLASIHEQVRVTAGFSGVTVNEASTVTYNQVGTGVLNVASLLTRPALAARLLVRVATLTNWGCYFQAQLLLASGAVYHTITLSDALVGTTSTGRLLDFGDIPIPLVPFPNHGTSTANLTVNILAIRNSNGGSAAVCTLGAIEVLLYYDFCVISNASITSTETLYITSYPVQSRRTLLPLPTPVAVRAAGTPQQSRGRVPIEGTAPRYRRGATLWLAMTTDDSWAGTQNTGHTASVTAWQAPQWRAVRAD